MLATKISSKGQLVVPKEVRTKLKIEPGTFFVDNLYGRFAGEKILDELEKEHAEEIEKENRS